MKALLKFASTPQRALALLKIAQRKSYVIRHKNEHINHVLLSEEFIAKGGSWEWVHGRGVTSSFFKLGLGSKFGSKWEFAGPESAAKKNYAGQIIYPPLELPTGKSFQETLVHLDRHIDAQRREKITQYIIKHSGEIEEELTAQTDLYIYAEKMQNMPNEDDASACRLCISVGEFLDVMPVIRKQKEVISGSIKLARDLKEVRDQLRARDYALIDKALETLQGCDSDIDQLTANVQVKSGKLIAGPDFTGTGPANVFLHYALIGLLSAASDKSKAGKIRKSIKALSFVTTKMPRVEGFTSLKEMEIILDSKEDYDAMPETMHLGSLGTMSLLQKLRIAHKDEYMQNQGLVIRSLSGLEAPALIELDAPGIGLLDIEALSISANLQALNLSNNSELTSIEPLTQCSEISAVNLQYTGVTSLKPLSKCCALEEINISDCANLTTLDGIKSKKISSLSFSDLSALESIETIVELDGLQKLTIRRCQNLTSFQCLESLNNITSIFIDTIGFSNGEMALAVGPSQWPASLKNLTICSTGIAEVGKCPPGLTELNLQNNPKLANLGGISGCPNIVSDYSFDLSGCTSLRNLSGINFARLQRIVLPETLENLDSLKIYPNVEIVISPSQTKDCRDVAEANGMEPWKKCVEDIPDTIGSALSELMVKSLAIGERGYYGFGQCDYLLSISGVGRITSLSTLDLSNIEVLDITAILQLPNLENLMVKPATALSKRLGKATFKGRKEIEKLQLKMLAGLQ